jgi:hypothetical protein
MLTIDEAIIVNQIAQNVVSLTDGAKWFAGHTAEEKRRLLRGINVLVLQASPNPEDASQAVSRSQLKATLTPCVVLLKPGLKTQLAKLAELPDAQLEQAFRLLIALLCIADSRRRKEKPLDLVNHWWHRNLADPKVLDDIRRAHA